MKTTFISLLFCFVTVISLGQMNNQFYTPLYFPTAVHHSEGSSISTNNSLFIYENITSLNLNLYGSFQHKNHGFNTMVLSQSYYGFNEFHYKLGYAYQFKISDDFKITTGVNIGINQVYHRNRTFITNNPNDPILDDIQNVMGKSTYDFDVDFGFGIQYKKFDFQLSFNDIISKQAHHHIEQPRTLHLLASYQFKFGKFNLNPGIYNYTEFYNNFILSNVEFQLEMGYNDRFFIAPVYKTKNQAGLRARVALGKFSLFYGAIFNIQSKPVNPKIIHEFGLKLQFNKPN